MTLVAKQDQIVWAAFGVFWAANAVLLVALFTSGDLPKQTVGLIVSVVGIALSLVWLAIEHQAVAWLKFYGTIVWELEQQYLHVPSPVAFTGHPERVKGMRVRPTHAGLPHCICCALGRGRVVVPDLPMRRAAQQRQATDGAPRRR